MSYVCFHGNKYYVLPVWNCQGIGPKRKELQLYLKENNFDIVALNETFLTKKIDFKIQGYDTIKYELGPEVESGADSDRFKGFA